MYIDDNGMACPDDDKLPECYENNLTAGGQGRTPEEVMQGAQIAVWIWLGLIGLIVIFAVIGASA